MSDSELDVDGVHSEQATLARQRELRRREWQDLQDLKAQHSCKRGMFCLVKQASLSYDVSLQGHELHYALAQQKQTFVTMVGSKPLKVTQQSGPSEGSILCHCHTPDCKPHLIKTLCGLRDLIPFN
ncbi:14.7K [Simian adenovirus 17]|uniref:14.7K n=1 Tax=Simian adenovirus 17 TaxID=1715779 RepID=A0A2H4CJX7_9ADEN|nr:14.7K [Simian adenovirus 17]